jgi:hypothetical protein
MDSAPVSRPHREPPWRRNLLRRPAKPARHAGRLQTQVRRAFIGTGKAVPSTSELMEWVRPGVHRWSVYRAALGLCDHFQILDPLDRRNLLSTLPFQTF